MEENVIDFGEVNVPTSWDEITLGKLVEIEKYYGDDEKKFDIRDVIHILCDKSVDEVNALPMDFLEIILEKLSFLRYEPKVDEPTNKVEIDGETYIVNVFEQLRTGEYIALDTAIKNDKYDYPSFLAIVCRKEGEAYDSKFEADKFSERRKMWENISCLKVLPIISFFLDLWARSEIPSQMYSILKERLDNIAKNLETSTNVGRFRRYSMKRRISTLRKRLDSAVHI